jgi:hypothetical protein
MKHLVFLFSTILLLAGCSILGGTPTPRACTEIGCSSALTVNLNGNVPGEYTMQVLANTGEMVVVFCRNGQYVDQGTPQPGDVLPECGPASVTLTNFAPDEVKVAVIWGANGAVSGSFRPAYTVTEPNGPGCPPTCRTGAVSLTIP